MRLSLRTAIARSGRTQRALARLIGIREGSLSELVHGWATPADMGT